MSPANPTLIEIVRRLGGELYDGARRALVPGPGHGPRDRSVSLFATGGRILVHSFAGDDWRAVRDHISARGVSLSDRSRLEAGPTREGHAPSRPERLAIAAELWDTARPVAGSLAEAHARARAIGRSLPEVLRFHPAAPSAIYARAGRRRPALLAAIRDMDGVFCGVEVTYLTADGGGAFVRRKTVGGRPAGAAVRLDPAGEMMAVGEGVFTCLSASEALSLPVWALLAVGNLRAWTPPPGVRRVVIAADRGAAGEAGARVLQARLRTLGIASAICRPPAPHLDWNDAARARAGEGGGRTG